MRKVRPEIIVFLSLAFLCGQDARQERRFADWLYASGRFEEASRQFRRAAFFAEEKAAREGAWRGMLLSLLRGGKHQELLTETRLLEMDSTLRADGDFLADCGLFGARALLMKHDWAAAADQAMGVASNTGYDPERRQHAITLAAHAALWREDPARLAAVLSQFPRFPASTAQSGAWQAWLASIPAKPQFHPTSPVLSALCALILPGSGHWMNGYGLDGLQAFLIDGSLIALTALLLKEDLAQAPGTPGRFALTVPVGAVTLFVHAANVVGAARASTRHNEMERYRWRLGLAAGLEKITASFALEY